jgi:uncharacterized protein (DUF58 family)
MSVGRDADRADRIDRVASPRDRAAAARRAPRARTDGAEAASRAARRGSLRREQRLRPTARGLGTLLVGLLALVVAYSAGRREVLVVASAALLLLATGLLVTRLRRPRLEVIRLFSPPVVSVGDSVHVSLRIRNLSTTASPHLVWNDAIPWRMDAAPHELLPISGGGSPRRVATAVYELQPPRRGLYQIGPMVVEHEDPFGMARSTLAVGHTDQLVVVPALVDLPIGGPNLADGEGTAQLVQRRVTGSDDDLTTREYRSGDALRRVHWRASARRGELMVRQEEHRNRPDARILLDTRLGGYPDVDVDDRDPSHPVATSESFEWAVRMLASLGVHLDSSGFRVSIEETAPAQVDQLGERWDSGRREGFLTSLAGVGLQDAGSGDAALDRLRRAASVDAAGPVFAVVADPEDVTLDWLLRHRRGGDVGIAFAVEPRPSTVTELQNAGWLCVVVRPDDDPADAWRAASSEAGYARVPR